MTQSIPQLPERILTSADVAASVCRTVAELPDRNSPEDWPEAMLVTHDELSQIVLDAIAEWTDISAQPMGVPPGMALVPIVPADEMLLAANEWDRNAGHLSPVHKGYKSKARGIYDAMVAAAPQPPADHSPEAGKMMPAGSALPLAVGVEPEEPYNGDGWELLAMALAAEEHDDIHRLIWEGGPVPEPWGEVWQKYEGDAKRMIDLVQKHATPPPLSPPATGNVGAIHCELLEAARLFHNLTQGDPEVIIRPPSAVKRDAITASGARLREAIAATKSSAESFIGESATADFELDTWTFQMRPGYSVGAGFYRIEFIGLTPPALSSSPPPAPPREPLTVDQILSFGQLIDRDGSAWPKFLSEGEKRVRLVRRVEEHHGIKEGS